MENKTKIIYFYLVILFFVACKAEQGVSVRNPELIAKNSSSQLSVKLKPYNGKGESYIYFSRVMTVEGKYKDVAKAVHINTLDYLFNFSEDQSKINNLYYKKNPIDNYLKDKNHIYIYDWDRDEAVFFIAGLVQDYKVLGGAYLQVGNKVYWRGKHVEIADTGTFKTINVLRKHSEWEATIGMDKYALYNGDQKMNFSTASSHYFFESAILERYFPEK